MKAKKREEYRKALAMSTEYADKLVPKRDRLWRKHWAEEHINRTGVRVRARARERARLCVR